MNELKRIIDGKRIHHHRQKGYFCFDVEGMSAKITTFVHHQIHKGEFLFSFEWDLVVDGIVVLGTTIRDFAGETASETAKFFESLRLSAEQEQDNRKKEICERLGI